MLDQYAGKIKVVFVNVPPEGDDLSYKAAAAALAANKHKKFWEFHEMLFANADELNDSKLNAFAERLSLEKEKFTLDMQSEDIKGMINRNIGEALRAKVSNIPAVFINGKRLQDHNLQNMQQAIDIELNKQARSSQAKTNVPILRP